MLDLFFKYQLEGGEEAYVLSSSAKLQSGPDLTILLSSSACDTMSST